MNRKKKINKSIVYFWIVLVGLLASINILDNRKNELATESFNSYNQNERKYVYPLGNVIGVKASTDGVLVVGYEEDDIDYIGGLQKGDNIVKINNKKIENSKEASDLLNKLKLNEIEVTFERDNKYKIETIKTKYKDGKYKLGLWVRDKISGIGTATFYDPNLKQFKAIGHAITDVDTNELLKIKQGYIYKPTKLEILKGSYNKIGKIKGEFNTSKVVGSFFNNTKFGISGDMKSEKDEEIPLIEVGRPNDVKIGNAVILFEDKKGYIQSYNVKIESIIQDKKSDRDMIIQVIDKKLIEYTGGIIQGMSGAPIIQNNKIIGAITHVFKDNPKKGYGVFIEEMIKL